MANEVEQIAEIWQVLRDYIPVKDRSEAAEHLIGLLQETGLDERSLHHLANLDHELGEAVDSTTEEESYDDDINEIADYDDVDY